MSVINYTYQIDINQMVGAAPADGFIDRKKIQYYMVWDDTTNTMSGFATSFNNVIAKERANMRYLYLTETLSATNTPISMTTVDSISNGDANTAPSKYRILISYDRPEYLYTADELNPGIMLYGVDAIKRQVARVFTSTITSRRIMPDPMEAAGSPNAWSGQYETIVDVIAANPVSSITVAESNITVTQLYPEF